MLENFVPKTLMGSRVLCESQASPYTWNASVDVRLQVSALVIAESIERPGKFQLFACDRNWQPLRVFECSSVENAKQEAYRHFVAGCRMVATASGKIATEDGSINWVEQGERERAYHDASKGEGEERQNTPIDGQPCVLPRVRVRLERVPESESTIPESNSPGLRTKLGGCPDWIQGDETPHCPNCAIKLSFVAQVDSVQGANLDNCLYDEPDDHCDYQFVDGGMIYVFFCFECGNTQSICQFY